MISIIITSFREPQTIGKAIEAFIEQPLPPYELLVLAPDDETLAVARKYARKNNCIRVIRDPGKGKPAALSLAFKQIRGEIVLLSDGDVRVDKASVLPLLEAFKDASVGAATGRVMASNRSRMFGYWAHVLTETFHSMRLRAARDKKPMVCSGYLYAIRKRYARAIPHETLADDAFISYRVLQSGARVAYIPESRVYVKYPENLPDWIRQKKRTAGRVYQLGRTFKLSKLQQLREEMLAAQAIIHEIQQPMHIPWIILLIIMRAYIWGRVFFDIRLWKRSFEKNWERVESTK